MSVRLDPSSWLYAFPMIRAGGVFIFAMGAGVVLGALLPNRRQLLLIIGAVIATIAIVFLAAPLSAPLGQPDLLLAILFAVSLHFLPMAVAFGPVRAALGMKLCVCAGIGLWLRPGIPLNRLWGIRRPHQNGVWGDYASRSVSGAGF